MGELLESIPADLLPSQGGTSVAVVVTMTMETLLGGLAAAGVDTGHLISPGEARRLAARHRATRARDPAAPTSTEAPSCAVAITA